MRGIENDRPRGIGVRQRGRRGANAGDVRGDEAGFLVPRVGSVSPLRCPAHLRERGRDPVERAARRRHRILRVQGKDEEARRALLPQVLERVLDERGGARHADADDRRGSAPGPLRELGLEKAGLHLGPAADRRPIDELVSRGGLRRAQRRDDPRDGLTERREGNSENLRIYEELIQKGLELLARRGATELDEENSETAH